MTTTDVLDAIGLTLTEARTLCPSELAVRMADALETRKDPGMSMPAPDHDDDPAPILVAVPPLGDLLAGDPPDWDTEPVAPIDTDQANRWLYRIGQLDAADAADEELANTERARIDLWLSLQKQTRATRRDWLTRSLTLMHETSVRHGGSKTVHLPNGTLTARSQPPEWVFEPRFVEWATENHPDLLCHPAPEIDKRAAKAALDPTGDIVGRMDPGDELFVAPGVTVIKRGDKTTIRPARAEEAS